MFSQVEKGRDCSFIEPKSRLESSIVSKQSIELGEHSIILGHIKTQKNLHINRNTIVSGNLFAEGSIFIDRDCKILGNIFSQEMVRLSRNVCIGSPDKIKSVIGNQLVVLHDNVTVHGYISTEGTGYICEKELCLLDSFNDCNSCIRKTDSSKIN